MSTDAEGTVITCDTPPGAGFDLPVAVRWEDGTTLAAAPSFSYDAPSISSVTPSSGPATGGTQITILGNNFSTAVTVFLGDAKWCASENWNSDCDRNGGCTQAVAGETTITCVTPRALASEGCEPPESCPLPLKVIVGGQTSSDAIDVLFQYGRAP